MVLRAVLPCSHEKITIFRGALVFYITALRNETAKQTSASTSLVYAYNGGYTKKINSGLRGQYALGVQGLLKGWGIELFCWFIE